MTCARIAGQGLPTLKPSASASFNTSPMWDTTRLAVRLTCTCRVDGSRTFRSFSRGLSSCELTPFGQGGGDLSPKPWVLRVDVHLPQFASGCSEVAVVFAKKLQGSYRPITFVAPWPCCLGIRFAVGEELAIQTINGDDAGIQLLCRAFHHWEFTRLAKLIGRCVVNDTKYTGEFLF